ncbi:hypothetical protein WJX72_002758 [[Myrmecia] bisecta]|uniref:Uncharacterized protein n=1 Tax=[Myrmecia] bisecta TaxID=41462 RepID=A0AAW1PY01_9CHLO
MWTERSCTLIVLLLASGTFARHLHLRGSSGHQHACETGIQLRFKTYVPSAWESSWYLGVHELQHHVCETLLEEDDKSQTWLQTLEQLQSAAPERVTWNKSVFSRFLYENACKPDSPPVEVYIEPAISAVRFSRK